MHSSASPPHLHPTTAEVVLANSVLFSFFTHVLHYWVCSSHRSAIRTSHASSGSWSCFDRGQMVRVMTPSLLCCWETDHTHHKMLTQIYMYFHAEGDLSAVFISDMTATLLTSETSNWTSDFGVAESLNRSLSVMSLCLLSAHVGTVHSDPSTIPSVCWTTR